MRKSTTSTLQFFEKFPDQQSARLYLEVQRWPDKVECPHCGSVRITARQGKRAGYFTCGYCKEEFTVRTGTIFERSHVELHKWTYAMYLFATVGNGISSMRLAKEIGVTQKTAWFMLKRIREACGGDIDNLSGKVQVVEDCAGGNENNRLANEKPSAGRGAVGETPAIGAKGRNGSRVD